MSRFAAHIILGRSVQNVADEEIKLVAVFRKQGTGHTVFLPVNHRQKLEGDAGF